MEYLLDRPWLFGLLLALALAGTIELGRLTAVYLHIDEDTDRKDQMAAIRDGLFVLIGLLLGFTFLLAVPRFTERRSLIIEEAISIETAYRRAGVLPAPLRDHSRQLLRDYVDAQLDLDNGGPEAADRAKQIQEEVWDEGLAFFQTGRSAPAAAYVNAVNDTIDFHEKRIASLENRIPSAVWILILSVSLIAVFTRGLTLNRRFWLTLILAPITIAIVVSLIADLDTPSSGLIQLDERAMERVKVELSPKPAGE